MTNITIGEEVAPKLRRFLYFLGAGIVCTVAINKWKEWEKKTKLQQHQTVTDTKLLQNSVSNSSSAMVQKAQD